MRARRHTLSAWMVYETGKNWVEADADTAEAIDFLEYYARQMLELELVEVGQAAGERDTLHYIPLGVGAVIPPWNFPLAILTGMSSAAIVAGDTIVLKPASDSPKIAYEYARLLEEAGLPPGVCNFLTGPGTIAGETLVDHPRTRFIAFTGSKEVGLRINARERHSPGPSRSGSSARSWRWAARRRSWWTKPPISMPPPRASWYLRLATRDKSVPPGRAPSSSRRSTMPWWRRYWRKHASC
jgi:1-pyrroline-5-carboxylate dehydrogenase